MGIAPKIKSSLTMWLCAFIVALSCGETRAQNFFATDLHESGKIHTESPESIGDFYDDSRYDASECTVAPSRGASQASSRPATGVQANKVQGELGEAAVLQRLNNSKHVDVIGTQVRARTPGAGSFRVMDVLVRGKKTGRVRAIEVKTGAATRDSSQLAKDALLGDPLAPTTYFGRRAAAAGFPRGTPTGPVRTFEVNANSLIE